MQMGDIGQCDESAFEADHESYKNRPFRRYAFAGEDEFDCRNEEIVEMDLLLENLDISDEDDLNDLLLENVHIQNTVCSSISNKKTSQFSSNIAELKDLSKCAAILCSEALQSCPSVFAEVESSTIELGYESYVTDSNLAEDSLVPYHDSSKSASALKGSRARQGKPLDPKLHVTWAANVYDPPVTSSSHTVKGHRHHRPLKAKTSGQHKHKHMKAKPSHAGRGDRKHSHRRSSSGGIVDPRMARMQALARRSLQTGFGLAKIQDMDIAEASGQESSKCAGSFHSESPWPLPLPIAEAS